MDPLTGLVAGASLGVAFQALYDTITRIVVRNATIRSRLDSLNRKLERLSSKFNGFDKLYPELDPTTETLNLRDLLEKASALIDDCAGVRWWHLRRAHKFSKRLDTLSDSFEEFLQVDIQIAQFSHILAIEARIVEMNKKLDRMYATKVRGDGGVSFTPTSNGRGDGRANYENVRRRNHNRPGLRTEVQYERAGTRNFKIGFCVSFRPRNSVYDD